MALLIELRNTVSERSRQKKFDHFFSHCLHGQTVLDVGVSGAIKFREHVPNHFLRNYDRPPSTYTGLGIDNMQQLRAAYPEHRFVQYDGKLFPFADQEFDWAFSNAVIEHVGDEGAQLLFLNEMLRTAKNVYFTTPNRYFPVETHSSQLFRHWSRKAFDNWAVRNKKPWLAAPRLRLLSYNDLRTLLERSNASRYQISKNRFCGWVMTFSVIAQQRV